METTIGSTLFQFGRFVEAAEMLRDATEVRTRLLGPTNEYTLESRRGLAMAMQNQGLLAESLPLFEENFRTREPGLVAADIPAIIAARDLTNAYSIVGRSGDALALITRTRDAAALRLGPSHELTNRLTVDVASHLWNLGRTDEAITSARAAVSLLRAEPGESAPGTTTAMWQLARMARRSGSLAESEELLRAAIDAIRVRHGDSPAPPLLAQVELLFTLRRLERYEEAASLARSILAATTKTYGPDSHRTVRARASLARTLMYVPGSTGEAVSLATAAAEEATRVLADDDPNAWIYRAGQAEALRRDHSPADALEVLRSLSETIAATPKDPGKTVRTMIHQYSGLALMDLGRNEDAERALMQAWAIIEPDADINSEHRTETARALATLATRRGDPTAAEVWKDRAARDTDNPRN
jgi:tetratricopeptide (TPR) repeat protein